MTVPRVSLVVVSYDTMALALDLAEGAAAGGHEVVVVDNASYVGDRAAVEAAHPAVTFVWSETNGGYGAGANAGAAVATGDVVVVCNADVRIAAADLGRLAAAAAGGVAAPRFVDPRGALIRSSHRREPLALATLREYCGPFAALAARVRPGWHPTLRPEAEHYADHATLHVLGAVVAVDAGVWRRLGGFDEGFFLYREETDLCRRARQAGVPVRHVAAVVAEHVGDASSPAERTLVAVRAPAVRSHYRYIAKHFGVVPAAAAWALGVAGCAVWCVTGPDRRSAAAGLRHHLALVSPSGRAAGRRRSPPP